VPYGEALKDVEGAARAQAAKISAEMVEQGGPDGMQEKEVIALIAYVQRLGTDINAVSAAEAEANQ